MTNKTITIKDATLNKKYCEVEIEGNWIFFHDIPYGSCHFNEEQFEKITKAWKNRNDG